jgi:hypothetical protein
MSRGDGILFLDLSSFSNNNVLVYTENNLTQGDFLWRNVTTQLKTVNINSYSEVLISLGSASIAAYFDAWYLQDLGVSDAYDAGFDAGSINANENADLLVTGFTAMVGILVNFVLMIVNLEVLGVSILGIFSIILLFTTIVWVLKLIRG